MSYFVTYTETQPAVKRAEHFKTVEEMFAWLQNYYNQNGSLPSGMAVHKGDALLSL